MAQSLVTVHDSPPRLDAGDSSMQPLAGVSTAPAVSAADSLDRGAEQRRPQAELSDAQVTEHRRLDCGYGQVAITEVDVNTLLHGATFRPPPVAVAGLAVQLPPLALLYDFRVGWIPADLWFDPFGRGAAEGYVIETDETQVFISAVMNSHLLPLIPSNWRDRHVAEQQAEVRDMSRRQRSEWWNCVAALQPLYIKVEGRDSASILLKPGLSAALAETPSLPLPDLDSSVIVNFGGDALASARDWQLYSWYLQHSRDHLVPFTDPSWWTWIRSRSAFEPGWPFAVEPSDVSLRAAVLSYPQQAQALWQQRGAVNTAEELNTLAVRVRTSVRPAAHLTGQQHWSSGTLSAYHLLMKRQLKQTLGQLVGPARPFANCMFSMSAAIPIQQSMTAAVHRDCEPNERWRALANGFRQLHKTVCECSSSPACAVERVLSMVTNLDLWFKDGVPSEPIPEEFGASVSPEHAEVIRVQIGKWLAAKV
jgi:hypothetical protein